MEPSSMVRVVSSSTVKPRPRPRHRIPLTSWDIAMISTGYIQRGLLFHKPSSLPAFHVVDHLAAALGDALCDYYPVAGRLVTDQHRDELGNVVGCSVSIQCDGQGVEVVHAHADGVSIADVIPHDADVPRVVQSFFPLDDAVGFDGHELPLFVVQVTELVDGVFVGFVCNHVLADGTALWVFLNDWARIARAKLNLAVPVPEGESPLPLTSRQAPLLERWSADGGTASPIVLPYAEPSELIERPESPQLRTRMLHFSAESLELLKELARTELHAAGDTEGAAALTRFQALSSLVWRCITRARRLDPEQETTFRAAINNRARLRPALPAEYFGNCIDAVSTERPVCASMLLERGKHGWAAAAVGRAVAAHTDEAIRAHVAAWMTKPVVYTTGWHDPHETMVVSSPRFDMYGCDFGWGRPLAARGGRANKIDGWVSLYPGQDGGDSMDAEVSLTPEHMAALEQDEEFWAAVSKGAPART
ncbi:protein ENHANCED PSEUDOMONAS SUSCEPTIBILITY 1-like [Lolium perenne]|uniref:protein ENHANCED PSEUDOMONAS SUSCEPTIBILITY 1-like n=1 Tax=Lolium perenne TaxID=4522 RepID=UPI0021F65682|nr:protein ENHANCED PSEUDOMONAS SUSCEPTIBILITY 1-like [Lolium perenne]